METRKHFLANFYIQNATTNGLILQIKTIGFLSSIRKFLFSTSLLFTISILFISCNKNEATTKNNLENIVQKDTIEFDEEMSERPFFNIDNKELSSENFENLICGNQSPREEYLDEKHIYQNQLSIENDINSKILFTTSNAEKPLRIYLTHHDSTLYKLTGFNLIGQELVSVFYISNFKFPETENDVSYNVEKALIVLSKDTNQYYTTIIEMECGNRECGYSSRNSNTDKRLNYLHNLSNYEKFMRVYNENL